MKPHDVAHVDTSLIGVVLVCNADDCERVVDARGLCHRHYCRVIEGATIEHLRCPRQCGCDQLPIDDWCDRFRRLLAKRVRLWSEDTAPPADPRALPVEGPCWTWQRARIGRTPDTLYGRWTLSGRVYRAHRVSLAASGVRLGSLMVDHRCRNTLCVNPAHLDLVTNAENKRRARGDTCRRGHPMTPENTYTRPDNGAPQCRACIQIHIANRQRKRDEARRIEPRDEE